MKNKSIFILILVAFVSCNPAKKMARYNEDVKRGIAAYVENNPCVNDTITETKSDTITAIEFFIDTVHEKINDTIFSTITQTKTVVKTIRDTFTRVVTDSRLVNFYKDSLNAVNRTKEAQGEKLAATTIESNGWKNKARNRLYLLIGVTVAATVWTFRKTILKAFV